MTGVTQGGTPQRYPLILQTLSLRGRIELSCFPECLEMGCQIINLPIDQFHEFEDMEYMATVVKGFEDK